MTAFPPPPHPILKRSQKQAPLSFPQESMWLMQQLDPENDAYNLSYLVRFTGAIDASLLERALNETVRRHEPLRTIYQNRGGQPVQMVQPYEPFPLPLLNLSSLPEEEREPAIQRFALENGKLPFNLQQGPLVRFALLHKTENEDYLFFCTHHISFDAWSEQIFFSELMQCYGAFHSGVKPALPDLPVQYADYAEWQREWLSGKTLAAYLDHWKNILSGDLPILELPTDRPRSSMLSNNGARHYFCLPPGIKSSLEGFCVEHKLTFFQLLLAAYALLLMRYTGQEDIIIGCPFANRARPELNGLIGMFVNTLPIRVNLAGNPSVRDFLGRIRTLMKETYPWQAAPFEVLVSELAPQRNLGRTPVFQTAINMRNVPRHQTSFEGLGMESILQENIPIQFEITLEFNVDPIDEQVAALHYNVELFDETTISSMVDHFLNLLADIMAKVDHPLSDLEMLSPAERNQLVLDWNNTGDDFPQVCIHDLFAAQGEKHPDALAVVCNGNSLTYRTLENEANQLAHHLRANGVKAESLVGIYLPRSEKIVVTLLAILKAGGAYVPIDLAYPPERIAYMLQDSDPAVVVTLSHLSSELPDRFKKIYLDGEADAIAACKVGTPDSITDNDSLAYVMYTSGSTGRPKGAMNIHKGIVNQITHMIRRFHFDRTDRVVQFSSLSFDSSVWNILGTLSYGGTIILMDDVQMRDPDFIYAAIIDNHATHINLVPTMLRAICGSALMGGPGKNSLRLISVGGEVLREADVKLVRRAFGDAVKLNNQYGPTECSISSVHYLIQDGIPGNLQNVPIGNPIRNTRVYILDKYLQPVPVGVKGEVFIGGVAVGRGYWKRPDLTAERFISDPFWPGGRMYRTGDIARQLPDGTVCYLGRSDDQVKIRGYRVELNEIEAVANEFPGIREAAVILWRDDGPEILAAYITLLEGHPQQIEQRLHAYLSEHLPFYMLPASIIVLDEMPLTASRKINRGALPRPENKMATDHYLAPRNEIETRLVSIWQDVLGVDQVGVRDNFFELGGHSLLAVRLLTRIQEDFGQTLPLMLLFQDGTIEALAEFLSGLVDQPGQHGATETSDQAVRPDQFRSIRKL
jgi:amino acid adenylation domain-containing protein